MLTESFSEQELIDVINDSYTFFKELKKLHLKKDIYNDIMLSDTVVYSIDLFLKGLEKYRCSKNIK
jgi:hypothetical protein